MSVTFPQYPNTTFPDVIQTFDTYVNITQDDVERYEAAQRAMLSGNLTMAQNMLNSIPNIKQKALTSEKLNTLIDTVQALETYYSTGTFESTIQNFQTQWQAILNYFSYVGEWNSTTTYKKNNMVSYSTSDGGTFLFIAMKDIAAGGTNPNTDFNTNKDNPSVLNWFNISIRGEQGPSGATADEVSFVGEWDATTTYSANNIVIYDSAWWISLGENTNSEPSEDNSDWQLVIELSGVLISPVYTTSPDISTQQMNQLHFVRS